MSQNTKPRAGTARRETRGSLIPLRPRAEQRGSVPGKGQGLCESPPGQPPLRAGRCGLQARGESGRAAQTHRPDLPVQPCSCGPSWESFEISLVEAA